MLDHAQQDQWPQVTEIELQRQILIKACLDNPIPLSVSVTVSDNIKQVMQADHEISRLCEIKRGLVAADINGHRASRKACQNYQQCG